MSSKYSAKVILVCPYWRSSTFWSLLFKAEGELQSFIKDVFLFEDVPKYIKLGNYKESPIDSDQLQGSFIAFHLLKKFSLFLDIISKEMVRKFEKVNKSLNLFKPLLSKVSTKAKENRKTIFYSPYFEKWKVLYMMHLLQTGKTFPVITINYFAINYFHSIVGYQNPCPSSLPYDILEGIKQLLAYSVTKKSSVTLSQLHKMYNCFGSNKISLSNL